MSPSNKDYYETQSHMKMLENQQPYIPKKPKSKSPSPKKKRVVYVGKK